MGKTLLVGLDAACWEYVQPLLDTARMPRLQNLMDHGVYGSLTSTMPPWTPAAWASLVTGKNPGKHGIFDMTWRRPGSYDFTPTNAGVRTGTPFWERLNAAGLRVGLVNVPFTYPLKPLDGFAVAGFGTPSSASDLTYPPEVLSWIEERFGGYEPTVDSEFLQKAYPADILAKEMTHQTIQVRLAAELANEHKVDVLVINLMLTDHANHKMPNLEQVQEAYCQADSDLGELIDTFRPDNTMLISDHGSSRVKGDFLLYAWLRDKGYYVALENSPGQRQAALNWLLVQYLQKRRGWSGLTEKAFRKLTSKSFFRLPTLIQTWYWRHLDAISPHARDYVLYSQQPDLQRTLIFPGSAYAGLLYLNLADREPEGIIPIHNRRAVAAELASELLQITDPDSGRPLFTNVYHREELYTGSAVANAPDLILDSYESGWNVRTNPYSVIPMSIRDEYFVENTNEGRDFGWHSREGLFIFSGSAFSVGQMNYQAHLLDISSTLLFLHDVPIPEDYDGRALRELMSAEFSEKTPVYQPGDDEALMKMGENTFTAAEADEVARHLRALGYLD